MELLTTSTRLAPAVQIERILDQMEEYDGWLDGWRANETEDEAE